MVSAVGENSAFLPQVPGLAAIRSSKLFYYFISDLANVAHISYPDEVMEPSAQEKWQLKLIMVFVE